MEYFNKHYYSINEYLKKKFGQKVYKLSLNAGMTCPNRDGTLGNAGCIFCSKGGSGDFAENSSLCITDQIESAKNKVKNKISNGKYIAYFQSYTNTYAPIHYLKRVFLEAIMHPDIVALSIATRPDCLSNEVLDLLRELNNIKPIWIELGLQTIHESTAKFIRRGYNLEQFNNAVINLKKINVDVIVHLILGLPYETEKQILESIKYVSMMNIDGIKLQLLHVLEGTDLAKLYYNNEFQTLTFEQYIDLLIKCIEIIPANIVIHRITGDGPKSILISPKWSANKKLVLNTINKVFDEKNVTQGRCFQNSKVD